MPVSIGLPIVSSCSVESCGYNHDGCHAGAISVGGAHGACHTFVDTESKGGADATAAVGACSLEECQHNENLMCTADSIAVGGSTDVADCLTFAARV
ncbi:DUF1540 domain-containing protein [Demequina mangrovi]|uniref:DUF1540 domain-containing protein n=1 Tax=Demequina mangrovi TaxID=1043493 RepID=A0A1H7ADH7_9MICO|nr:DUF1540 domain-containing protein [Demequina mangrovi]SEJ63448.1 protein of unknown function [Demequina mangrovi]